MLISFSANHLSIDKFENVRSEDFMVLTGVNGSGKSHLLEGIELKKILINGAHALKVVRFNFETFRLENESAYNAHSIAAERQEAWSFFQNNLKASIESYKNAVGVSYASVAEQCRVEKKPLWLSDSTGLDAYKTNLNNIFAQPGIKNNQASIGLYSLAQQLPYSLDEIREDKFVSLYKPFSAKQDFLPVALGKVIWDYYIKYRNNQVNNFENQTYGKDYATLTEQEFIEAHGEKPWEIINTILSSFNSLEYRINSPEGSDIFGSYVMKLVHTKKEGLEIDFSNLSSGERVLMALVASIYKSSSDNYFPDMLLLDELDASLHPSMMKNMLAVIRDVFLARGVKVILVTHSPTTIALAPEESVYVMNRSGPKRIEKRSRNEALAILTEGFATLEESLLLFDEITRHKVSIVTEGNNSVYLKKALERAGLEDRATLIEGAESISGKSQLRTLFDFFSRVPHINKVLFVWDCDATYTLRESSNTIPFTFKQNPTNTIATSGIENLFPEHLFSQFLKTITRSQGTVTTQFDEGRKRDFERHALEASPNDWENFEPFLEKVRSLLGPDASARDAAAVQASGRAAS